MKKRTLILLPVFALILSLGLSGCKKDPSQKTSNNDEDVILTEDGDCSDDTWDTLSASFDRLVEDYALLSDLDDEQDVMSTLSEDEQKQVEAAADVINNFADTRQNNYTDDEGQALIKEMDTLSDALEGIIDAAEAAE